MALLFALLVFVLPFILGNWISKAIRMPSHATSIGIILAAVIGAGLILWRGELRKGPDISGGTILVYEIDRSVQDGSDASARASATQLVPALTDRLNPTGTKEIVIRPYGEDQIEIIVPQVDQLEVAEIKRVVQQAGILKFRIVANPNDHPAVIQAARSQANDTDLKKRLSGEVRNAEGQLVGLWHTIGRDPNPTSGVFPLRYTPMGLSRDLIRDARTGAIIELPPGLDGEYAVEKFLKDRNIPEIDLLMSLNGRDGKPFEEVTGDDLATVSRSVGQDGSPEVEFGMRVAGAKRLLSLTARNTPNNGIYRHMAIILDGRVLSAPRLNSPIREKGVIQGNFTSQEVEFLVSILQSGSLPASLGKEPISENQIGAVLGASTIRRGLWASLISLVAVLAFVLLYYRFAGVIACISLLLTLLLTGASMVLIQQPVTLAGLAGLVLTVAMSFDASVLVFERMREEIARRATGRMAIRNGFDRAMSAIVDSNLTTIISGLVLYAVGTDQVRGFAVVLVIGIVISMFTAVFCSRVFFEVAERLGIANFSMSDAVQSLKKALVGDGEIDFMKWTKVALAFSLGVIGLGLLATAMRGRGILDIDFNGGTSVVFTLDRPADVDAVRDLTSQILKNDAEGNPIQSTLTTVAMAGQEPGTVYRLDSSLQDMKDLTKRLTEGFAGSSIGSLVTYRVESGSNSPAPKASGAIRQRGLIQLVSYQEQPATAEPSSAPPADPVGNATVTQPPAVTGDATLQAAPASPAVPTTARSDWRLKFMPSKGEESAKIYAKSLLESLVQASNAIGQGLTEAQVEVEPAELTAGWNRDSMQGFADWKVSLPYDQTQGQLVIDQLQKQMQGQPVWLSVNKIGERVAGQMQTKALAALVIANLFIAAYIWFRFQKLGYGLAAVLALVHDVLFTLAILAFSHWVYRPLSFLGIEDFKIGLTVVAAFLTIIGYSLNDTIVVFDRIREIKGKSPRLTTAMINKALNETLSRTLLTSSTTIIVIMILYWFGGDGIHAFMFCLLVGILVGTYSSVFVAAPLLLWWENRKAAQASKVTSRTAPASR
jgi:SecD/SecF fusion protein